MEDLLFDDHTFYSRIMAAQTPDGVDDLFVGINSARRWRCEAIRAQMQPLYLLAFLLTANHEMAERVFISAIDQILHDDTIEGDLCSWSKKIIALKALNVLRLESYRDVSDLWTAEETDSEFAQLMNAVTRLETMERCVFVLLVLERFSETECAVLLDCDTDAIAEIKVCAFQHLTSNVIGVGTTCSSMDA